LRCRKISGGLYMTTRRSVLSSLGALLSVPSAVGISKISASAPVSVSAPLHWKLSKYLSGGLAPFGDINILETAVIASGEQYREVLGPDDCPSFSRPLASYISELAWILEDHDRQLLLRFVGNLVGSADDLPIEQQRAKHISLSTMRRVFAPALAALPLIDEAWNSFHIERAEEARTVVGREKAKKIVDACIKRASPFLRPAPAGGYAPELEAQAWFVNALGRTMSGALSHTPGTWAVAHSGKGATWYRHLLQIGPKFSADVAGRASSVLKGEVLGTALNILDEAFAIGKCVALPPEVIVARLEAAKKSAGFMGKRQGPADALG
jgi:hypothetical protein